MRRSAIHWALTFLILAGAGTVQPQVVESGFGTSSLLRLDPGGRFAHLHSERVYGGGRGLEQIYTIEGPDETYHAFIAEHADIDGDGMDDIALVWGNRAPDGGYVNNLFKVYDGFSGAELVSHSFSGSSNTTTIALVIDDFDGDGREEFVFALADPTASEEVILTYIDSYEGVIRERILQAALENIPTSTLQFYSADFDGDHRDDIGMVYVETVNSSAEVAIKAFDVQSGEQIISTRLPAVPVHRFGSVRVVPADVHGGRGSSIAALVTSEDPDNNAARRGRLYLVDPDGKASLAYDTDEGAAFEISSLVFADLAGDGSEDVVVITSIPHADGMHSEVIAIDASKGDRRLLYSTPAIMGETSGIYLGLSLDLERDGLDEIVVVEHAPRLGTGQSASKLTAISGGKIQFQYEGEFGASNPERILQVFPGDFDNDTRTDLLVVHGESADARPPGASVTAVLLNDQGRVANGSVLPPASGDWFVALENEISDVELLRAINMDTNRHDLWTLKTLFSVGRTSAAITELFRFFRDRGGIDGINLEVEDWYFGRGVDILVSNIRKISTAAAKEDPCFGCHDNVYRSLTAAGRRTGRVLSTMLHRLDSGERLGEREFVVALKALYAQMIWKSREGNATIANNHGTLFELDSYLPTAIALSMFKAYDASSRSKNWLEVIDQRLAYQVDHVFDDGVHDEHSFYYAYRISSSFNRFLTLLMKNTATIRLNSPRMAGLQKAISGLNEYMIYAVKPIEPKLDEDKVYTASDIPVIGDTKGLWVRSFGKQPASDYFDSFLNEPVKLGHTEYWDDAKLAELLSFVADPRGRQVESFDLPATRYFDHSGIFISRSNWLDPNGAFDYGARYAYFRGGELIPRPGPYYGYSTWSHHAHADLLSVELSGYNDNLIVESGGLLFPDHLDIIKGFDRQRYTDLYGYESSFDDFLTARHYFKGTAAHSTVYVNKSDQAIFKDHFRWSGYGQLKALETHHIVADELDYYSAGIDNEKYQHRREMYYVKPQVDNVLCDDYWLFVDHVAVEDRSSTNRVEQIWHVSPSQRLRNENLEMARIETDNMVVVHARLLNSPPLQAEVVDTYNLTDFLRIDAKAIKFVYDQSNDRHFTFATVILPFGDHESVADVRLEEIDVRSASGLPDPQARAFKLGFSRLGVHARWHEVEDYIFISAAPHGVYAWSPGRRGTDRVMTNKRFELHRRVDGEHAKTMVVDWDGVPDFDIETAADENSATDPRKTTLAQNYPNPFNGHTVIGFSVARRGRVHLSLYSLTGQKVSSLVDGLYEPGKYTVRWAGLDDHGRALASGVYLYRLRAGDTTLTRRLLLVR